MSQRNKGDSQNGDLQPILALCGSRIQHSKTSEANGQEVLLKANSRMDCPCSKIAQTLDLW